MEFGVFTNMYHPKHWRDGRVRTEHETLKNELEYIEIADRAGFKYSWSAEHHFLDEYSHLSASESFMAYVIARTKRIHVGSAIMNITRDVNHPARCAERVAMLDHLSEGRFEFGTGRGSSSTEVYGFGIPSMDRTRELWDESLPQIVRMWREEEYAYEGDSFSMPPRRVLPKPYTNPHPPIWVAAGSPGTFEKAARLGIGVLCFTLGTPDTLAPLIEIYKNNIDKAEPVGGYVNNNVMVTSQMLCLEDGNRARKIASDMTSGYQNSLVYKYLDTFPKPPYVPDWPATIPEPSIEMLEMAVKDGAVLIGSPEECEAACQKWVDTGADQLTFGMLSTTMPVEVAIEAVETFGRTVLPVYDKDPVHSTTRQREAQLGPQPVGV
jgi:alkanesulfonate monooxygenase SsuD/methylene tetrahydromethanopterin reductase-like flavin-dependent oxidoreductase (luciferase family)